MCESNGWDAHIEMGTLMKLDGLRAFPISGIRVTDPYIANSYKKEMAYLTSLKTERLLAGFRETAGLGTNGVLRYPGWESTTIGGHTLGHYMCAVASGYMSGNSDEETRSELLRRMKTIIKELKSCQDNRGTGYIFGARLVDPSNVESQFNLIEREVVTDIIQQAWVPWYTMHKILSGLVAFASLKTSYASDLDDVTLIADTALAVMGRLADWVYKRTSGWNEGVHRRVLDVEYGGMNDIMYSVYLLTGKKEHLEAAHAFDDEELFERVTEAPEGSNILANTHANTTIPKFIGAMKRYTVTGEVRYLEYARTFWSLVTEHHSYITGNNSRDEHFRGEDELNKDRAANNCETCNAYNMMKFTKLLFEYTGDGIYTDFAENLYFNTILSSQNPETGMTTYFQPMGTGYFKCFSSPYEDFWCCTGTGMENFSKPGDYAFYAKEGCFAICDYISADVSSTSIGLKIDAQLPERDTVKVLITRPYEGTLALRLPEWMAGEAAVKIDGEEYGYAVASKGPKGSGCRGFALIGGPFDEGSTVEIRIPMALALKGLKDDPSVFGFKYGPIVLSARLGDTSMETSRQGVNVLIPKESIVPKTCVPTKDDVIHITEGSFGEFVAHPENYLQRDLSSKELKFGLRHTNATLTFGKHYEYYSGRYGIYFSFTDEPYYGPAGKPSEPFTFYIEPKEVPARQDIGDMGIVRSESPEQAETTGAEAESGDRFAEIKPDTASAVRNPSEAAQTPVTAQAPSVAVKPAASKFIEHASGLAAGASGTEIDEISCSIGAVYFSALRNAYIIRVPEKDPATGEYVREVVLGIALNCDGYVEVDRSDARKDSIRLDVMRHRFTGHRLRLYDPDCRLEKDYAVIVETVPENPPAVPASQEQGLKRADAAAPVRGSFPGEVCYIMDATGDPHADLGTYNSQHKQPFGADPETGYVWGVSGDSQNRKYRFELEDGSYEVQIGFDVPEWIGDKPSLYQNYRHDKERLLASDIDTTDNLLSYKVRVSDGLLALSLVSDDGGVSAWRIEVHSMQTTAVENDSRYIVGIDPDGHILGEKVAAEQITAVEPLADDDSRRKASQADGQKKPETFVIGAEEPEKSTFGDLKPISAEDVKGPLAESNEKNTGNDVSGLPLSGAPGFIEIKNPREEAEGKSRKERLAEEVRKYLEEQEIKQEAKRIAEEQLRQADSRRYFDEQLYRLDAKKHEAETRDLEATRRYVEEQYRKADVEHYVEQQRLQADSKWRLEQQKQQLEVQKLAEAQRLAAKIRQQNEAQRLAEAQRVAEDLRIQAEAQRLMEQQRHEAEAQRVAEAQRIADELRQHAEAQLLAEQKRQQAESERLEAIRRLAEEQKRRDEEHRRAEEMSWLEAANKYADEQSRQRNAANSFSSLYSRYGYPKDERSIYDNGRDESLSDDAFELPTVEKIMSRKSGSAEEAKPAAQNDDFTSAVKSQLKARIMQELMNEMGVKVDVDEHEYKHESSKEIWFRDEPSDNDQGEAANTQMNIPAAEEKETDNAFIAPENLVIAPFVERDRQPADGSPDELVISPELANALSAYEVIGEIGQPEVFDDEYVDYSDPVAIGVRAEAIVVDDPSDYVSAAESDTAVAADTVEEVPAKIIESIEAEMAREQERRKVSSKAAAGTPKASAEASQALNTPGNVDAGELGRYLARQKELGIIKNSSKVAGGIAGALGVAGGLYAMLHKKK